MAEIPPAKLIVRSGPEPGQEFNLSGFELVVGRDPSAGWVIPSPLVSRHHARIFIQDGSYSIEDLGSSNGTFLNGSRLTARTRLRSGDVIKFGQAIELEFRAQSQSVDAGQTALEPEMAQSGAETRLDGEQPLATPPRLEVSVAGEHPQTYTLQGAAYSLGRSPENDIVVPSMIVSGKHARLERVGDGYRLLILPEARNPVYLAGRAMSEGRILQHGDVLRIGGQDPGLLVTLEYQAPAQAAQPEAQTIRFGERSQLSLGRDSSNNVVLPAPNVSRFHAQVERVGGRYRVRDLDSSNGTYVNDQRVSGEVWLTAEDALRIGPYRFVLKVDQLAQYDESQGLRVEAVNLNKWVRKDLNILQNISLVFQPREFIVVVGQSGGGKSTLVDAVAGYRPATHGQVLVNGIDVYRNFDAVRNEIGFVPQKDIIHTELTVYQALEYAARLRMPPDTSAAERRARVMQVLEDLDLTHRKDVQISGLSGGQVKRVSIGVELLTKPGLFFLDEPTSGLDPGTETALMQLMRRLADQGRTIILITHATKNVMLADKVAFLARGGYLAWFGPPNEALEYFDRYRSESERRRGPMEFDEIYAILDNPAHGTAADWAQRYAERQAYQRYIVQPLSQRGHDTSAQPRPALAGQAPRPRRRVSALRQFFILSERNLRILTRDRFSLFMMLAAPPVIGLLSVVLALVMGRNPFDFYEGNFPNILTSVFMLTIYGVMVGGLSQMREIVKESAVYKRERLVNLKILPYVLSKIWVAGLLALYQALAYTAIHYLAFKMPGGAVEFLVIYLSLALATMVGMMLGLFSSALAPNSNAAPLLVIMLMLPQIVLGGALIPLPGTISAPTATRWAFQGVIAATGVGTDVAADPCWLLDNELLAVMTLEDKQAGGCRCMGVNIFDPNFCDFPGSGEYYSTALEESPPAEPAPPGDPPLEPIIPTPPAEPANQADSVAVAEYLGLLRQYQQVVDQIQADYKIQVDGYQSQLEVYQAQAVTYQQSLAEYEIARNAAVGQAEGAIATFRRDFAWTFVDKNDPGLYWGRILQTWSAQLVIIGIVFLAILILMKRKDAANE